MKTISLTWYLFLWMTEQFFGTKKLNWTQSREAFYKKNVEPFQNAQNFWDKIEIVQVDYLDDKFIRNLPHDRPLLLKGAFMKSRAVEKWSWDYLRSSLKGETQAFTDTSKHNFNTGIKDVNQIIDNILSDDPKYSILFGDIIYKKDEFFKDLETEKWIDLNSLKHKMNLTWQFFAAGKGRKTNLHGELGSSLSLQIRGKKTWTIIPPEFSTNLYPRVSWRMYLESNYFADFASVKNKNLGIRGYQVTLEPGDILWCPSYFWHFVENESASVSVSYKWTSWISFARHPILSAVILTSRYPSAFMRLPLIRLIARFHPPVG
jgi:hypothetical protein